jgi:metallophosphoesterase (TIGR03767 family)
VSQTGAILTVQRTLVPGAVLRRGTERGYHALAAGPGEAHAVRDDLVAPATDPAPDPVPARRRPLLAFAHATDLQLADVQSPGRFEFCNRDVDDPRFRRLIPMHRPQEALAARAVHAMVGTLNAVTAGPVTGVPVELVVTTGDAIDNAQWNEMRMFLALLEGGPVRPGSGGPGYEGVQSLGWADPAYWTPDGERESGPDRYRTQFGFPQLPGLLDQALAEFRSEGLRLPWLGCFGNHEVHAQGLGLLTPEIREAFVGATKPVGYPTRLDRDRILELVVNSPEILLGGPQRRVIADPARRAVSRTEFVEGHFGSTARPVGHGFNAANRRDGTAYYSHDVGPVRLICLDTTCRAGASDGCLDDDQLRWFEQQLREVHSTYLSPDGSTVTTTDLDRLVVVFSHHGIDTMTNRRGDHGGPDGVRLHGGPAVRELLHRFRNVVLWLNGHQHRNRVLARTDSSRRTNGFWEVTSSSLMDWPCQARVVELADNGDGTLSVLCTMVDHHGVVQPDPAAEPDGRWLAGMHRELAANEPWRGIGSGREGGTTDRNVDLRLRAPFRLDRLSPDSSR